MIRVGAGLWIWRAMSLSGVLIGMTNILIPPSPIPPGQHSVQTALYVVVVGEARMVTVVAPTEALPLPNTILKSQASVAVLPYRKKE